MFKNKKGQTLAVLALLAVAGTASAEIPAAATAAMTSVGEFTDTVITWAWGVGTSVIVAFVGLKLTRKGAQKAT
ncbi:major coat protein [Vibrio furnissii]|uniref:major coat protein n=1 Tax=Vibrio furnissii TaxID=29494 RepID=UPI003751611E